MLKHPQPSFMYGPNMWADLCQQDFENAALVWTRYFSMQWEQASLSDSWLSSFEGVNCEPKAAGFGPRGLVSWSCSDPCDPSMSRRKKTGIACDHQNEVRRAALKRRETEIPSGYVTIAIEQCHSWWISPLNMVIFHGYVCLPEGTSIRHLKDGDATWNREEKRYIIMRRDKKSSHELKEKISDEIELSWGDMRKLKSGKKTRNEVRCHRTSQGQEIVSATHGRWDSHPIDTWHVDLFSAP